MLIAETVSLCPECLRRLPAKVVRQGDEVWLERTCPEHGEARALVWRGLPDYEAWRGTGYGPHNGGAAGNPLCPTECGLCWGHARKTCCVLVEVTERCDLGCPVCFASSEAAVAPDPPVEVVEDWFRSLLEAAPGCNIQLSGGEPTVRDDLPELIERGRSLGHSFFQLNTNGLRLAREPGYAERLAEAGLSTVFLQFDGVDDAPYVALRGRPLAEAKRRAVERCGDAGLGVVLVPTVARDVNLDRLGAIFDFALEHLPVVRGIHIQPMALLGRYPELPEVQAARVTLPDAMRALVEQSGGRLRLEDLTPGKCEHPICSFSREFRRVEDGSLIPLGRPETATCDCKTATGTAEEAAGSAPATEGPAAPGATDATAASAAHGGAPSPAAGATTETAKPCCCGDTTADTATTPDATAPETPPHRSVPASEKAASVRKRWKPVESPCCCSGEDSAISAAGGSATSPSIDDDWARLIHEIRANTFSISGMAFQDAWTIDLERLRHCCLHVIAPDGRIVPFCAYNLTSVGGEGLPGGRWGSV